MSPGLRARDAASAARAGATLTAFSGLVLLPRALFLPPRLDTPTMAACVAVAVVLLAVAVLTVRGDAERAAELVDAVRRSPLALPDGVLGLTVIVGAAHAPTDAADLTGLDGAADAALQEVKRAGRDGFAVAAR